MYFHAVIQVHVYTFTRGCVPGLIWPSSAEAFDSALLSITIHKPPVQCEYMYICVHVMHIHVYMNTHAHAATSIHIVYVVPLTSASFIITYHSYVMVKISLVHRHVFIP